jgi:hypothetical protein
MTMLCGTDNITRNILDIPRIQSECGEYLGILRGMLSVPQNIVMNSNNVMTFIDK